MASEQVILTKTSKTGKGIEVRMREYTAGSYIAQVYLDGQYITGPSRPQRLATAQGEITHYLGGGFAQSKRNPIPAIGLTSLETATINAALDAAATAYQQSAAGQAKALREQREELVAAYQGAIEDQRDDFDRAHGREDANAWQIKDSHEATIATTQQAIRAFDAAHPEIIASIKAEEAEAAERNRWM